MMKTLCARFIKEQEGQDLVEYALLGACIALVAAAAIATIGADVNNFFGRVNNGLTNAS
jgi:Flp pilus assembly pilin Flp